MAQAVFSTQFCSVPGHSGGPTFVYSVPAGHRALIKCMTIVWGDVTVSGLDAWFMADNLTKLWRQTLIPLGTTDIHSGGTALGFGSWVLNPGEHLLIQAVSGTADFQASGYLLTLP